MSEAAPPLTLTGPVRYCRVLVVAGQVDGGTIADAGQRGAPDGALVQLSSALGLSPAGKTQDQLAQTITQTVSPRVTQGLYRRVLTGAGATTPQSFRALCTDPNYPQRLWVLGTSFAQLGYTDDDLNFTAKGVITAKGGDAIQGMYIQGGYTYVLTTTRLLRAAVPDVNGTSIAGAGTQFTTMFDLDTFGAGRGTATGAGTGAVFRNSCVAISGANVYLLEYGAGAVTNAGSGVNGPSVYYSADSGATWTRVKTFSGGKHGHAIAVIGGLPWASIGDGGTTFPDIGLWNASTVGATTWAQRNQYGEASGGNTFYGINMLPLTVLGQPMIVLEYDGIRNKGPLFFPSQGTNVTKALLAPFELPAPYLGTMRGLTLDPVTLSLYWVHTGEGGAVGPRDTVWAQRYPYDTAPVLLEDAAAATANTFSTIGDPVYHNGFIYFGTYRITVEKFIGQ